MPMVLSLLATLTPYDWLGAVWALGYCSTIGFGIAKQRWRSWRARSIVLHPAEASPLAKALLVRPCAGDETGLTQRLVLTGGATHVVFCIESESDPAHAAVLSACGALVDQGVHAEIFYTHAEGPNHKVAQLAYAAGRTQEEVLFVADSDVALAPDTLLELKREFQQDPELSACWCPPLERSNHKARTWGDRMSGAVLSSSLHAFSFLAAIDRASFVGKVFAIQRSALVAIGGFAALTPFLGEDMEMGRRLRAKKLRYRASKTIAVSERTGQRASTVVDRFSRWLTVILLQRPMLIVAYPLFFLALPLACLTLPLMMQLKALPLLAAMLVARLLAAVFGYKVARGVAGKGFGWLSLPLDIVLAETTLIRALYRALTSKTIVWRGRLFEAAASGTIREIHSG
jgi:ceramide glucosyltransferase